MKGFSRVEGGIKEDPVKKHLHALIAFGPHCIYQSSFSDRFMLSRNTYIELTRWPIILEVRFEILSCYIYLSSDHLARKNRNKIRLLICYFRTGLLKRWVAKLNFGIAKHRPTMSSHSKWGRQLKKLKKRCFRR